MLYPVLTAFLALVPNRVVIRVAWGRLCRAPVRNGSAPPLPSRNSPRPATAPTLSHSTTLQDVLVDFSGDLANLRLSRGLTLESISERTKIGQNYLQAIESRKYGLLPQGIYARSYLTQYAAEVAVSREALLFDYCTWLRSVGDRDGR